MAAARAAAAARNVPLYVYMGESRGDLIPLPEVQIVGGGLHANGRMDIQDFLFIPHGAPSYAQAVEMVHNVYHAAGDLLRKRGLYCGVADEGGYWPQFDTNEAVLQFLVAAIEMPAINPAGRVDRPRYGRQQSLRMAPDDTRFISEDRRLTTRNSPSLLIGWCRRYPIVSIEDPMSDTDWEGWGDPLARTWRPGSNHRRRPGGDQCGAPPGSDRSTGRQCRIDQTEPGGHGH